jgi:aminoglycoside 6'-N-acetyltransferase I
MNPRVATSDDLDALLTLAVAWAASIGASQLEIVIAPNDRDVSHLFRYYAANGFTDEGRRLLCRPLPA